MDLEEERIESELMPYELRVSAWKYVAEFGVQLLLLVFSVVLLLTGLVERDSGLLPDTLMTVAGLFFGSISVLGMGNVFRLLRDSRPALRITEEGVLNRTVRASLPFLPWGEIVDIRKRRRSRMLHIYLRNPRAFWKSQPWSDRVLKLLGKVLGAGDTVPIYLGQLDAPRHEVARRILEIVETREIAGIREAKRIGGPENKDAVSEE